MRGFIRRCYHRSKHNGKLCHISHKCVLKVSRSHICIQKRTDLDDCALARVAEVGNGEPFPAVFTSSRVWQSYPVVVALEPAQDNL